MNKEYLINHREVLIKEIEKNEREITNTLRDLKDKDIWRNPHKYYRLLNSYSDIHSDTKRLVEELMYCNKKIDRLEWNENERY